MSDKMVFWNDTEIRGPKTNLAMNKACVDMVKNEDYDLVARVYRHSKGVILGFTESPDDVNKGYCKNHGYEITSRPSGGSAIIVDPELNLSYSVFFKNSNFNVHEIYQKLTIPLAKKLGDGFSVEGNYYLRYKVGGEKVPIAGHAMKSHEGVTQFDGVIHLKRFDKEHIDNVLNLRELWNYKGENYLKVDNAFFDMKGDKADIDVSNAYLVRSEKDELEKIIGLEDIGLSYDDFAIALQDSLNEAFGDVSTKTLYIDDKVLQDYLAERESTVKNPRKYLGHCFVDLVEEEQSVEDTKYGAH